MSIILYSTHCPKCNVLEKKLKDRNVEYEINTNVDEMIEKGYMSLPVIEVDGEAKGFSAAISWINKLE